MNQGKYSFILFIYVHFFGRWVTLPAKYLGIISCFAKSGQLSGILQSNRYNGSSNVPCKISLM